jgi:hypothetical protein
MKETSKGPIATWLKEATAGVTDNRFQTQEQEDAYNEAKLQELEAGDAGYAAGGPVDPHKSKAYQQGQYARIEADSEKPWLQRIIERWIQ